METPRQIALWLTRLGQENPAPLTCEALTGGVSGSSTYCLLFPSGAVVLKATEAGCPPVILARARREVAFYRHLAAQIPLSLPHVLASYDAPDSGCALLLNAYHPAKPAEQWSQADYLEMADQLARFHAAFWNREARLADTAWLRPMPTEEVEAHRQPALDAWQTLRQHHPEAFAEHPREKIAQALEQAAALKQSVQTFPKTLCHNDCHIGNLLRDGERLLWADWQEVGLGHGPEDLAFLYQRADTPPDPTVLLAYQQRLEAETGAQISFQNVQRVVVASELWTRLVHWPHYLVHAPHERVAYHLQRIDTLLQSI